MDNPRRVPAMRHVGQVASGRLCASDWSMDDHSVTSALDRINAALARAETAARGLSLAPLPAAGDGELSDLRARHDALKQAVATGLRQIDEMLAGMAR